ncbi:sodium channel regulatory subunit beta-3-like isoform X1 [Petromyzon marinus]|uniref:sodium channel regulatory subunit beta-3-like isoform X1 n=1 Tax=Petromyzon marinus TaxID=7757 RepID=UPI003F7162BA
MGTFAQEGAGLHSAMGQKKKMKKGPALPAAFVPARGFASPAEAVCVEVDSVDRVVVNNTIKLTCISCRKRQEQDAFVDVTWTFQPDGENTTAVDILVMKRNGDDVEFTNLQFGSSRMQFVYSEDYQEVSLNINDTKLEDKGTYRCHIRRVPVMPSVHKPPEFFVTKTIHLEVVPEPFMDITAKVSEVMMYFMIVASTVLLIFTLITCYMKVKQADKDKHSKVTDLLVIAPVNKENCATEQAEEELKSSS